MCFESCQKIFVYVTDLVIHSSNVREYAKIHIERESLSCGDRTVSRGAQLDSDLILADVCLFNWEVESESTNIWVIVECDTSQP